ncbi:Crp/Fnr family transcriptional regulator [Flavobacterium sp.]
MSIILRNQLEEHTSLSNEEFDYIMSHFEAKKLKKHQFLVQENENVEKNYFVISGCLKAYHVDSNGKEHILQFAIQNWWITDFQAFFNRSKATLFVDCIEQSEVLGLSFDNAEKLCAEMHKMEQFFRKKSNSGYVALQQRILSMLNNNPQERYDKLVLQNPILFQKVPKKLIASYLGVSRETLSRFSKISKL